MRRHREPHTLVGAYAIDAVGEEERARFERHLADCPACRRELRELREAAASLAHAVATEPPRWLIRQAIQRAAVTRQLAPPVRPILGRVPGRLSRGPVGSPGRSSRRRARPTRTTRTIAAGAAAIVAVAVGASLFLLRAQHQLAAAAARDHEIATVLNAPDAVMLTARVTAGGTATVVVSRRDRAFVFTTSGLPEPPPGRCYELWLMGPAGDRPAGVLPEEHAGMTSPVIAFGISTGDSVALALAWIGGMQRPPAAPLLMLSLRA